MPVPDKLPLRKHTVRTIGHFMVPKKEPKLYVSDAIIAGTGPTITNAHSGKWSVRVTLTYDESIAMIEVTATDKKIGTADKWIDIATVGIDSGTAAITTIPSTRSDLKKSITVTANGVTSMSGFGDGGYKVETLTKNKKTIGVRIEFINPTDWDENQESRQFAKKMRTLYKLSRKLRKKTTTAKTKRKIDKEYGDILKTLIKKTS